MTLIALAFTLLWGTTAASAAPAAQTSNQWIASYWNNITLSGDPVLTRPESAINYNWGAGSPAAEVDSDRFSARWSRTVSLPAGTYRFDILTDDGARLFLNNQLIIDAWETQSATSYSADVTLTDSPTLIEMEYFENTGNAVVQLSWTQTAAPEPFLEWRGEYFNNRNLSGEPILVRNEPNINFDWGARSPADDVLDPDAFSARWSRTLDLAAGSYRFAMTVDDGGRLFVNNQPVIDAFFTQGATTYLVDVNLPGGPVPIVMEYFENGGLAVAQLTWQRQTEGPAPGPNPSNTIIVDNSSPQFVFGGPSAGWNTENEGLNGSLRWTQNSFNARSAYNWGVWYPNLEPGRYRAAVYIPERFTTSAQARYWVSHANGFDLTVVDQVSNSGRWVTLGTYEFDGTDNDYVSLADVTFEEDESRLVAYDAVRFTPVQVNQPPVDEDDTAVTLNRQGAASGSEMTATGTGFPPGQTIFLRVGVPNAEPFGQYAQGVVDGNGAATLSFIVPETRPNGLQITADELVVLLISQDGTSGTASFQYIQ